MRGRRWAARAAGALLALCMGCAASDDGGGGGNGESSNPITGGGSGGAPGGGSGGHGGPPAGGGGAVMSGGSGGMPGNGNSTPGGSGGMHVGGGSGSGGGGAMATGDAGSAGADGGVVVEPVDYPAIDESMFGMPVMIADTFSLAEGPVWDHCSGVLLFTDVDAAVIHKLTPPSTIEDFRTDTNYANGLAFDPDGRLVMAQMGPGTTSGKITRVNAAGMDEVIVDKGPMGVAMHASDDLAILSDGTIYFTDPEFAHGPCTSALTCNDLIGRLPIYSATTDGTVTHEGMTTGPNGVDASPDEKTLYVNSYFGGVTMRFTIGSDHHLTAGDPLATGLKYPDSMCIDDAGNVYVGVREGVDVFTPDGTKITTIAVPQVALPPSTRTGVTNCGFGGEDGKTLYITGWTTLWRVDNVPVPGHEWVLNEGKPCN